MADHPKIPDLANQSDRSDFPTLSADATPSISRRKLLTAGAASAVALFAFPQSTRARTLLSPNPNQSQPSLPNNAAIANACTVAPTNCASPALTPPSDDVFFAFLKELNSCKNPPTAGCNSDPNQTFRTLSVNLDVSPVDLFENSYVRRFQFPGTNDPLLPGPTLCVYPGDQISLFLRNQLPRNGPETYCSESNEPIESNDPNRPHCFNSTNLHFHGLHVSPSTLAADGTPVRGDDPRAKRREAKSSDDVLLTLNPKEQQEYCLQLPDFHAPGTHWYHAHVHGTTALDMANGLVGALIVKEPPGEEILAGAPDVVMVIQEVLTEQVECEDFFSADFCNQSPAISDQQYQDRGIYERRNNPSDMTKPQKGTFLINGREKPTLRLKVEEVQRWRLINATGTPRGFMTIEVVQTQIRLVRSGVSVPIPRNRQRPILLYRVAIDGITLYGKSMRDPEVEITRHELSPGNRVDFLVSLCTLGKYELRKTAFQTLMLLNQRYLPQSKLILLTTKMALFCRALGHFWTGLSQELPPAIWLLCPTPLLKIPNG